MSRYGKTSRMRSVPPAPKPRRIMDETYIIPEAVARSILAEVARYSGCMLPPDLEGTLIRRADLHYNRTPSFAEKMRAPGNAGRDTLRAFMQHWLAAELQALKHPAFAKLPQSFWVGEPLPEPYPKPPTEGS